MQLAKELTTIQIKQHVEMTRYHLNVLRESLNVKKQEAFPYVDNEQFYVSVANRVDDLDMMNEYLNQFLNLYVNELEEMEL